MSHPKTEAKLAKFSQVKIGMIGETYHGQYLRIRDKGTVSEMCETYPYAPCGLSDFEEAGVMGGDPAVVCNDGGSVVIFSYGEDGFWVNL